MKIPEESRRTLFFKLPVLNAFLKKAFICKSVSGYANECRTQRLANTIYPQASIAADFFTPISTKS